MRIIATMVQPFLLTYFQALTLADNSLPEVPIIISEQERAKSNK